MLNCRELKLLKNEVGAIAVFIFIFNELIHFTSPNFFVSGTYTKCEIGSHGTIIFRLTFVVVLYKQIIIY